MVSTELLVEMMKTTTHTNHNHQLVRMTHDLTLLRMLSALCGVEGGDGVTIVLKIIDRFGYVYKYVIKDPHSLED